MKITLDQDKFGSAALETPLDAICVKKRDMTLSELSEDRQGHGLLVYPCLHQQLTKGSKTQEEADGRVIAKIREVFLSDRAVVTVRGHGWFGEDRFVWKGTVTEFIETWVVD